MARARNTEVVFTTPFFDIVAKPMPGGMEPYFTLQTADYVTVFGVTPDQRVPMVRQYRPAVDAATIELPSGHVDEGEAPEDAAHRELEEETGYRAGRLEVLGVLKSNTGRLDNRLHCFFASELETTSTPRDPEEGIERVELSLDAMVDRIRTGEFDHALHLGVLFLAIVRGALSPTLLARGEKL